MLTDIPCSPYFDLYSTFVACSITTELTAGAAQPGTVLLNSTTVSGKTVTKTCSYEETILNPAIVPCNLSTLEWVKAVSIIPVKEATLSTTTVIELDNVVGRYYSSS